MAASVRPGTLSMVSSALPLNRSSSSTVPSGAQYSRSKLACQTDREVPSARVSPSGCCAASICTLLAVRVTGLPKREVRPLTERRRAGQFPE